MTAFSVLGPNLPSIVGVPNRFPYPSRVKSCCNSVTFGPLEPIPPSLPIRSVGDLGLQVVGVVGAGVVGAGVVGAGVVGAGVVGAGVVGGSYGYRSANIFNISN